MRFLLLQLNVGTAAGQGYLHQAGCAYLAGSLRAAGHETYFRSVTDRDPAALNKTLGDFAPDVVGIYLVAPMEKFLAPVAAHCRARLPGAFLLAGGPHPTLCPDVIETAPALDAILRGEGERALVELADRLGRNAPPAGLSGFVVRTGGEIVEGPLRPLLSEEEIRALPAPYRGEAFGHAVRASGGRAHVIFSRGCPFACTYCSNEAFNKLYGFRLRFRSVEQSLAEVDDLLGRFPVTRVGIDDDIITLRADWFESFFRRYAREIRRPFVANVRVGSVTEEQLRLLREAGCERVQIGIESGDPAVRETVLKRSMSNDDIVRTFRAAQRLGLRTMSFNMVGLPHETPEAFRETIRLNARLHPNEPGLHIFYPYRGTAAFELCRKEGWLAPEGEDFVERADTILRMPKFPREAILEAHRTFYREIERQLPARYRLPRRLHREGVRLAGLGRRVVRKALRLLGRKPAAEGTP